MSYLKLSKEEVALADQARKWVKANKKKLIDIFANLEDYPPTPTPVTILMAGSPGAGKTEFSKNLIETFDKEFNRKIARIDPDDIKEQIPGYNGKNSYVVQGASSLGVDKLVDHVMQHNQDVVIDGTFADYRIAEKNISRSLAHNRTIFVVYVYYDPRKAWDLAKKREKLEGRFVPKETFVEALFAAKKNVNKAKGVYKDKITLITFIRGQKDPMQVGVENINKYVKIPYTKDKLNKILI